MSFWSDYQHFCTKITTKKSKQRWILRKTVFFFFFFSTSGILGFVFGSYYLCCKRKRACLIVKYHVKKSFPGFSCPCLFLSLQQPLQVPATAHLLQRICLISLNECFIALQDTSFHLDIFRCLDLNLESRMTNSWL